MTLKCWFIGGFLFLLAIALTIITDGMFLPVAIPMMVYALMLCGVKL